MSILSIKCSREFFILSGAKLYMDWILPTNPTSKNPLIRFFYGWAKRSLSARDVESRLKQAYILGATHFIMFTFSIIFDVNFIINMLVNVYPIIIQLHVGYRCWKIKNWKRYERDSLFFL